MHVNKTPVYNQLVNDQWSLKTQNFSQSSSATVVENSEFEFDIFDDFLLRSMTFEVKMSGHSKIGGL